MEEPSLKLDGSLTEKISKPYWVLPTVEKTMVPVGYMVAVSVTVTAGERECSRGGEVKNLCAVSEEEEVGIVDGNRMRKG